MNVNVKSARILATRIILKERIFKTQILKIYLDFFVRILKIHMYQSYVFLSTELIRLKMGLEIWQRRRRMRA